MGKASTRIPQAIAAVATSFPPIVVGVMSPKNLWSNLTINLKQTVTNS